MPLNSSPETLPWYRSHVIVGSVIAVLVQAANAFGLIGVISADVQSQIVEAIVALTTALAALYAVWGRVTQKYAPPISGGKVANGDRTSLLGFLAVPLVALMVLPGCTALTQGPQAAADQTVLDEKFAFSVESAYKAANQSLEAAIDAGLLDRDAAVTAKQAENRAKAAVDAVRAAYDAGNAAGYEAAIPKAREALAAFFVAINGGNDP